MVTVSWPEWQAITLGVVSMMLALVSLAYMIGIGFHLPKLQAWAKDELYQALASVLLSVLLISFVLTIDTTMQNMYGGDPFDIAIRYIQDVTLALTSFFTSIVSFDVVFQILKSMLLKAMPSQTGFTINPFVGVAPLTQLMSMAMEAILGGMGLMLGMSAFLLFIKTQLPIILPIGLALRAFPWSRPAGGALIAVFIGFYVFFPFLWVFDRQIYLEVSPSTNLLISAMSSSLGSVGTCLLNLIACFSNTSNWGAGTLLTMINSVAYPSIYYMFIFVLLLPMFNLIMVLILINELAKIFGSEIDISGLSGLI